MTTTPNMITLYTQPLPLPFYLPELAAPSLHHWSSIALFMYTISISKPVLILICK